LDVQRVKDVEPNVKGLESKGDVSHVQQHQKVLHVRQESLLQRMELL
jgi:hypothetical protein